MRILLTGAAGWVGGPLVDRLLQEGHVLVLLGRSAEELRSRFDIPCEIYEWNPESSNPPSQDLLQALNGIHAVIHLAREPVAQKRWSDEQKRKIRNSRVQYTRQLVDMIIQHPGANPDVFICASAIDIYGDRGEEPLNESASLGAGFFAEVCRDWEREAKRACEISPKIRCVQLRIGVVLSRDREALPSFAPWVSWIHIDDLVDLIRETLRNPKLKGAINAVSPAPAPQHEFSQALARALNRPSFFIAPRPTPRRALQLAFGEMSQVLLASQRALPVKAIAAGFRFQFTTVHEALENLYPKKSERRARNLSTSEGWAPTLLGVTRIRSRRSKVERF